jgi:hypothetical protein
LTSGQSCRIDVGEASVPVRSLTVRREHGRIELGLTLAGPASMKDTYQLPTSDDEHQIELQFGSEGGRFTITCRRGGVDRDQCLIDVS